MNTILDVLIKFFEEDGWSFELWRDEAEIRLSYASKTQGHWDCLAQAHEEAQQLLFFSEYPFRVPEEKLLLVAEYITRANNELVIGNFILDFEIGVVRFKTSLDVNGLSLNTNIVKQLVYANVLMMEQYISGIKAILERALTPLEAIVEVEEANY